MARFFVPNAADGRDEELYAGLATFAGRAPQPPSKRIESITYIHDGIEWTATVGRQLAGTSRRMRTRQGKRVEVSERHSDRATVMAIFPGVPFVVVTDKTPIGATPSNWVNPFMAGEPKEIRYFDAGSGEIRD